MVSLFVVDAKQNCPGQTIEKACRPQRVLTLFPSIFFQGKKKTPLFSLTLVFFSSSLSRSDATEKKRKKHERTGAPLFCFRLLPSLCQPSISPPSCADPILASNCPSTREQKRLVLFRSRQNKREKRKCFFARSIVLSKANKSNQSLSVSLSVSLLKSINRLPKR